MLNIVSRAPALDPTTDADERFDIASFS
jgi:hypothetical protein